MKNMKIIWTLVVFLALAQGVLALGIAPASKEIMYEANSEQWVDLKITNNDGNDMTVILYAEGEFADYIEFQDVELEFTGSDNEKKTRYKITLPEDVDKQGILVTKIVARAIGGGDKKGSTQISAEYALISKLKVVVPYEGKYLETKVYAPHFAVGKSANFALEAKNFGTEDVLKAKAIFNIYGKGDEPLRTLVSNEVKIPAKDEVMITVPWTPDLGAGRYQVEATLLYDGMNKVENMEFQIGALSIDVLSISVDNFKLGSIAQFDLLVQNNWNEEIPLVYADVHISDFSGKTFVETKTLPTDLAPLSLGELQAFWNTQDAGVGDYQMRITLNYVGQTKSEDFNITVLMDEIRTTSPIGQVIGGSAQKEEAGTIVKSVYLLIFLVVILIGFNIFMFFKKVKKTQL